jgi:hypothetical protein
MATDRAVFSTRRAGGERRNTRFAHSGLPILQTLA